VTIEDIVTLTDELLAVESTAAEQRGAAEHAQNSRVIYSAAGALGVVSALLLVLALLFGWYSGWGLEVLVANLVVAVGMLGVHATADRAGHRARCLSALIALGLGVLLAAIAPWWLPWWVAIAALVMMLVNGAFLRVRAARPAVRR
jgi:Na+-translocating ferredoxin:NAD+ oxidoreductase RnfD subunit